MKTPTLKSIKIESENKNLSETATTDEVSGEDISVYELNNQNNENNQKITQILKI